MKNLVVASIIAVVSAMSAGIPAEAAIPIAPVQAPTASTTVTDIDYYQGPYRSYYRGPYRTYYRGPYNRYYGPNYYVGARCHYRNVRHYRNGRVVVNRVRVCR